MAYKPRKVVSAGGELKGKIMQLKSIQALRAIAAMMVLVSHLAQSELRFVPDAISAVWMVAGVSGVDLFFVISGVVMVLVTRGLPTANPRAIGSFLYARVTRIYPIYWLFTFAMIAAYLVLPGGLARSADDLNIVSSLLLLPSSEPPVLAVSWTLVHEMYFYLAFAVVLLIPARWLPAVLLGWMSGVVAGQMTGLNAANPATYIAFHPLTTEFVLGCVIGLLVMSGRRRFGAPLLALGVIWWIAASIWLAPYEAFEDIPMGWDRVVSWGVPAALIVYGALCLELDQGLNVPAPLTRIGDWSYALYLCHLPIVALLSRLWADYVPDLIWLDNLALLAIGAVLSLGVAAAAFHLFERPVLKLTRKLGGEVFQTKQAANARTPAARIW